MAGVKADAGRGASSLGGGGSDEQPSTHAKQIAQRPYVRSFGAKSGAVPKVSDSNRTGLLEQAAERLIQVTTGSTVRVDILPIRGIDDRVKGEAKGAVRAHIGPHIGEDRAK